MLRFILRRIIVIIPMLFFIVSLTWALVRLAPGNFYTGEKKLAPAIENNLREKYGLNKPWHVQYRKVLWNMARFDLGNSLKYEGQSVNQILWRTLPVSAASRRDRVPDCLDLRHYDGHACRVEAKLVARLREHDGGDVGNFSS
jgi:ABC-type microcin C transport system permease subunit YejB